MNNSKTTYDLFRQLMALVCAMVLITALLPMPALADGPEPTEDILFTEPAPTAETTAPTKPAPTTETTAPTEPEPTGETTAPTEPAPTTETTAPTEPSPAETESTEPDPTESPAITYVPRVLQKAEQNPPLQGLQLALRVTDLEGNDLSDTGTMTYGMEDVGKTFYYLVEETLSPGDGSPDIARIPYVLGVRIALEEGGMLTAEEEYYTINQDLTWEDFGTLSPDTAVFPEKLVKIEAADAALTARVELQGKTLQENEFSFVLEGLGNVPSHIGHDAEGKLSIPEEMLQFTAPGVYLFTLKQNFDEGDGRYDYDRTVYTIAVVVGPNAQGQPEAATICCHPAAAEIAEEPFFSNSYIPETEVAAPKAEETIPETEPTVPETEPTVPETEATTPETEPTVPETEPTVPETEPTVPETEATVPEAEATIPEAEATIPETEATVPETEPTVPKTEAAPTPVTAVIRAETALNGKTLAVGDFTLELVDPENNTLSAANGAEGEVTFSIRYDSPGTYVYVLREKLGSRAGMRYDSALYRVTVTVAQAEDGTLSAAVAYGTPDGAAPVFQNQYTPPPAAVTLAGTVELKGRTLKDGEFRFQVKDAAGTLVATGSNDAQGNILFTPIRLDTPGEYVYTVTQVDSGVWRLTWDRSQFSVTVQAFRSGDEMAATVVYPDSGIRFTNRYTPLGNGNPATGDSAPLAMLLTRAGSSGTALAVIARWLYRKKKQRTE